MPISYLPGDAALCLLHSVSSQSRVFSGWMKTRDIHAAQPYPLSLPRAQTAAGSTVQLANTRYSWRQTGKGAVVTLGLPPGCCRGEHRAEQRLPADKRTGLRSPLSVRSSSALDTAHQHSLLPTSPSCGHILPAPPGPIALCGCHQQGNIFRDA